MAVNARQSLCNGKHYSVLESAKFQKNPINRPWATQVALSNHKQLLQNLFNLVPTMFWYRIRTDGPLTKRYQWWIQGTTPHPGPISSIIMQFSAKILQVIGWRHPSGKSWICQRIILYNKQSDLLSGCQSGSHLDESAEWSLVCLKKKLSCYIHCVWK